MNTINPFTLLSVVLRSFPNYTNGNMTPGTDLGSLNRANQQARIVRAVEIQALYIF